MFPSQGPNDGPPGITQDTVEGTTLIQSIPFRDMDGYMDEDDDSRIISRIKKDYPIVYLDKLTGNGPNRPDIQVGRGVFQVISVGISHLTNPCYEEFGVYGDISVTCDNTTNKSYLIYDRKSDDPEAISPTHEDLSLTDCCIVPFMNGKVQFNLTTTNGHHFVASKDFGWSFKDNCLNEDELSFDFDNDYYGIVVYTIIPYALIGVLQSILYGPPNPKQDTIRVEGEITVNHISFLKKNEFILVQSNKEESIYRWEKSRKAVAVPAYSWIYADFSLRIGEREFATGAAGTSPVWRSRDFEHPCEDKSYTFTFYVKWILPDEFFDLLPEVQYPPSVPKQVKPPLPLVDDVPYYHLNVFFGDGEDEIDQPPSTVTSERSCVDDTIVKCSPSIPPEVYPAEVTWPDHYVEVFSVFVGGGQSTLCAFSGTIVVQDRADTVYIYSMNTRYPDNLPKKKFRAISLTWPDDRWVLDDGFYMHLKLKDDEGNNVCWGNLSWPNLNDFEYHRRFNRRMCAVIPGENDGNYFAAIHYSIFRNALRAKVTVSVVCEDDPCCFLDVCGSICVEYNNHDYSSAYDKEYYRTIILDRPWKYRAKVCAGSAIPLSKCLITAPSDCLELLFSVDLSASPFVESSRAYIQHLRTMVHLRFKTSKDYKIQTEYVPMRGPHCRGGYSVMVKVEWFDLKHGSQVIENSQC